MMILSLICSVMFFLSAIILFMPRFRKYPFFKPFGVYMAYQGIWTLLSYIVNQLFPTNQVMTVFNYLGSFVFCIYFLYIYYMTNKGMKKNKGSRQKQKTSSEKPVSKKSRPAPVKSQDKNKGKEEKEEQKREPRHAQPAKSENKIGRHAKPAVKENIPEKQSSPQEEPKKKKNRFIENSSGSDKYSRSGDVYDDIYEYMEESDYSSEESELDNVDDVEITDEDLEYYGDDDAEESLGDIDDIDIYEDFDDDGEEEEEESLSADDDIYGDDLFEDYDDEDEDEDRYTPKGSRYRK